jgi:hypothetical protein
VADDEVSSAPDWAAVLGEHYPEFRAALVDVLAAMQITADPEHIDCGVLHTPDGATMGLTNVVRLCHGADRSQWRAIIADHLRRSTAKPAPMAFDVVEPRLRLRVIPERHLTAKPDAYIVRELARELYLALAIDNPEHVVFVSPREPAEWGKTVDELFVIAERNTRDEPAIEPQPIDIPGGPTIIVLLGESYFAASHVLFLERYSGAGTAGHVVALPDRHALVVLPLTDKRWPAALGTMVGLAHVRFDESPGPITDQLYWRRSDGSLVKIPCGVREDGTPWVAPPDEFNELLGPKA